MPEEVDAALTGFGFAMGPFAMMDLAGLDAGARLPKAPAEAQDRPTLDPFTTANRLAKMGRLGRSAGRGWYLYPEDGGEGVPDPEVRALITALSAETGRSRRTVSEDEIRRRCLWQLVDTGCRVLGEGIAQRASDLDVISVHGYGFPRFRGGPMFHAESVGLAQVLEDMQRFHQSIGSHWRPAPLLERAVREGLSLREAMAAQTPG